MHRDARMLLVEVGDDRVEVVAQSRVLRVERVGVSELGAPSRTAMMVACARGWHLHSHGARAVSADWLAWPLVGGPAEALMAGIRTAFGDVSGQVATWIAARCRISEDWLAASGAGQYVILGAGLDSFAWRQRGGVRVFEADEPATQAWKRSRLQALGIPDPPELVWAPVDFEADSVAAALDRVGFDAQQAFVSWIGVIHYLSLDAIAATLSALPPCSLALTYVTPEEMWHDEMRAASTRFQAMAADAGEPLVRLLTPDDVAGVLAEGGFTVIEDIGAEDVRLRYGLPALSICNERIALATNDA
jgi:methyltransferase (TIGR00027 family)